MLIGLGLFTGLVAGSYPAFYLSRFQPANVIKRLIRVGRKGTLLRKTLVTFQFIVCIFLVVITIVCVKQIRYLENRPLGYESFNLVDINADGNLAQRYQLFKNKVTDMPGVAGLTGSSTNLIRVEEAQTGLDWPDKKRDMDLIFHAAWVQYGWVKTTGLTLVEGRDFSPEFGADSATCLINESAVKKMGLTHPIIGARVGGKTVIGVLTDFVYNNTGRLTQPLIVYLGTGFTPHFLLRLRNDGQWKAHLSEVEKVAKSLNPGYPFTFRFIDDEHQEQFKNDFGIEQLADIFSVMAILISCLGLFGLAGYMVDRRTKEICIRKILGASPASIWASLSADMLKPVGLGFIVATPLAVLATMGVLSINEYHVGLSWWVFVVVGAGACLIALATVSYHCILAVRMSPARSLRAE
jgi:hypothetical protein